MQREIPIWVAVVVIIVVLVVIGIVYRWAGIRGGPPSGAPVVQKGMPITAKPAMEQQKPSTPAPLTPSPQAPAPAPSSE